MTDLEQFRGMLDRAGIEYAVREDKKDVKRKAFVPGNKVVEIYSKNDTTQDGYFCFWAEFEFSAHDGSLVGTGVWE